MKSIIPFRRKSTIPECLCLAFAVRGTIYKYLDTIQYLKVFVDQSIDIKVIIIFTKRIEQRLGHLATEKEGSHVSPAVDVVDNDAFHPCDVKECTRIFTTITRQRVYRANP